MDIFDVLELIGGLCLFLFGMNLMGEALERRAGSSLQGLLGKLTSSKMAGFFTGLAVTAVIQSSSATTVMVVGFVNSGLMSLKQAINVIMGANVGTTITAWILSLAGIEGGNLFTNLLKPMSFTPVLALIGTILNMTSKSSRKKDTGTILLGFAVLMFGMDIMSGAVAGLKNESWFTGLFTAFENPLLALIAGALLTGIIQSSSASVGILQALSTTGAITIGASIPIIMGQNIGTTITALMSSVGANKNARRAAIVHLSFNVLGSLICLGVFCVIRAAFVPAIFDASANQLSIAVCHTVFNLSCTALMLPMSSLLEKLAYVFLPEDKQPEKLAELDERLLATPHMAMERATSLTGEMAEDARDSLNLALLTLDGFDTAQAAKIKEYEERTDHYEDILGTYLVKLSGRAQIASDISGEAAKLLKVIGDFERIADHSMNILGSAEEMREKKLKFSGQAEADMSKLKEAVKEILTLAVKAFKENDLDAAKHVEPLEQVIDQMRENMRTGHILRLQRGECSIEVGFVWSDLLTNLERVADHCSNVAGCVLDSVENNMNIHESLRIMKTESDYFREQYALYTKKYLTQDDNQEEK